MSKNLWFTISIALSLTQLSVHLPEIYPSHNPWVLLKIFHLSICRVQFICPIFLSFFCKQYSGQNHWLGAVAIISLCGFNQYKWKDPRGIKWCWGSKGKNLFLPSESLESPTFVKVMTATQWRRKNQQMTNIRKRRYESGEAVVPLYCSFAYRHLWYNFWIFVHYLMSSFYALREDW